jgi:hypothetical protein
METTNPVIYARKAFIAEVEGIPIQVMYEPSRAEVLQCCERILDLVEPKTAALLLAHLVHVSTAGSTYTRGWLQHWYNTTGDVRELAEFRGMLEAKGLVDTPERITVRVSQSMMGRSLGRHKRKAEDIVRDLLRAGASGAKERAA